MMSSAMTILSVPDGKANATSRSFDNLLSFLEISEAMPLGEVFVNWGWVVVLGEVMPKSSYKSFSIKPLI